VKTIKIYGHDDTRIWASISGKRVPNIKEINISVNKKGLGSFKITTEKKVITGQVAHIGLLVGGIVEYDQFV
jgi:hypothetical protein